MFHLTYEFKLKPTAKQIAIFEDWLEQCRRVYNYALVERKHWFGSRSCQINACSIRSEYIISAETKRPTYASQCKSLTAARANIPALASVQVQVLQQTLKRLEKAFVSMWEQNHGFPRFKKAGKMRSFVFPHLGVKPVQNQAVKLPKIGLVKFHHQSRPIPDGATIKQARVVKRVSGWYVMLTLQWDLSIPNTMPHGKGIGIDVALMNFIANYHGFLIKAIRFLVDAERKLELLQRRVSRKKLGSNKWKKVHKKVAKLHEYIANSRKDWHGKLAHQICENAGMIFVEDLNLVGLSRAMLGKHCLDAGWGQFFTILEQACFKHGAYFQKVSAHKTSQICPSCGVETGKKDRSERVHSWSSCGYTTDRDVAAAQVVLIRGLAAVCPTACDAWLQVNSLESL